MNDNAEQIEKAFYADGYRLGMQVVEANLSSEVLFQSIKQMYSAIDELIDYVEQLAMQNNKSVHCKKGCDYCCYQPVFALDYEMDYLNNFVKNSFAETKQKSIGKKAKAKRDALAKLQGKELLNSKHPCPLLKNGACTAYEARPMACRIYLSTSVESCVTFFNDPENKSSYPALLNLPLQAGRMMNEGFKAALKTKGIITKEFRIDEKLFV